VITSTCLRFWGNPEHVGCNIGEAKLEEEIQAFLATKRLRSYVVLNNGRFRLCEGFPNNMSNQFFYLQRKLIPKSGRRHCIAVYVFGKRFAIIFGLLTLAFVFCPRVVAQERNGWELDSLRGNQNVSKLDAQQVYETLIKMLDRWNAHDIEAYMEVYRKSPELLVVVDSEQFNGWQQLHDSYLKVYPDRNAMGFIQPKRIQVKFLKPDLALALTWWSVSFPNAKQSVVGNSTMNLRKFNDGWKIVASHTSTADM
jgi:ketosteroid isomerase-like protein